MSFFKNLYNQFFGSHPLDGQGQNGNRASDADSIDNIDQGIRKMEMELESQYRQLDKLKEQETSIKNRVRYVKPHSGEFRSLATKLKRMRRKNREVEAYSKLFENNLELLNRIRFYIVMKDGHRNVFKNLQKNNPNTSSENNITNIYESLEADAKIAAEKYRELASTLGDQGPIEDIFAIISEQDEIQSNQIEDELLNVIRTISEDQLSNEGPVTFE